MDQLAPGPSIHLPKANAPYRLCAIPYDVAQNAGRLWDQILS
jgi:hypothetical protein